MVHPFLLTTRALPGCPEEARQAQIAKKKTIIRPWRKKHRTSRIPEQRLSYFTGKKTESVLRSHSKPEAEWDQSEVIPGEALS